MQVLSEMMTYFKIEPWVVQVFVVVFAALLINYLANKILSVYNARFRLSSSRWDKALIISMRRPLSLLIWIVGILLAADIIRQETQAPIFSVIPVLRTIGVILCLAWFLSAFIHEVTESLVAQRLQENASYDRTTADAIAKLLRLSVIITAVLVTLQTLGFSIAGVLAFGGIGGIAISFAAKDLLANFFGGLMIYLDRPFSVGDWIRSPDREIEGTVEQIGWRLTIIRTFDKRPLYVPNAVFTTVAVENPSRMYNRRIFETIGIRYDDATKMGAIVNDVRTMLENHPEIDASQTLIVNFNEFAASSLNFFIYTFTKTTEWIKYHAVKEDVLLKIVDIITAHGAECAFPTTTLHVPDEVTIKQG